MAKRLREVLARHVEAGTIPGAIATHGTECDPLLVGSAGVDGGALKADAIVRIQSMTKLITTVAALRLVEQGAIALDDGIESWMPELADRRVLAHPMADVDDTVLAERPVSLRDLLTNQAGYGIITVDSPLQRALRDAGLEANNDPVGRGAQDWLDALATLPLAHQPGRGWRYHLGFGILGILLGRVAGTSTAELLRRSVLDPVGMPDTGFRVPDDQAHRLLPAYRRTPEGLVEAEPAGGGFHTGPAPFDESHSELVSTLADYHAFLRALLDGELVGPALLDELRTDQVDAAVKTPESFFPGFWDGLGWGFGVSVTAEGPHRGRFGWSGGYGTDFFVDPDGTICIVLAQVEMDERLLAMFGELRDAVG
ncbi:serine hydrolase domain-containing protein [Myceligenerans pegani]|uniref:Beta-lactamase family protein n=1 Tax=Myceligenerans pegani TaxID=2776917 RepID=A0ABR9N341_9MICO|nr:serine hydrolase domain-containing protein [Myceligenerans sp. TRM 65318]MBE1878075.1 beta-lactamase family protein [Myceligenerans sp. TRM 65318]MBE3020346.1 beta-lactamase family protein [Myceligenerans sp. TRM 65318]